MGTGLETLGDAAGHFPLVSAAVRDLELVFSLSSSLFFRTCS